MPPNNMLVNAIGAIQIATKLRNAM